jgi:uncharacterized protein
MSERQVVVSIHDVAPPWLAEVRWLLAALDDLGVRPRVLKVTPLDAGRYPLEACPELVALLRAEVAAGSEVVLHGYTHRVAGPLRGPLPGRLRARLFAGTVAEFQSLDVAAMTERLSRGRDDLGRLGLAPSGFCAPGWCADPALPALLRTLGFRYTVGMASLWDLTADRRVSTPWYGYMGAGAAHEALLAVGGRLGLAAGRDFPVVKVFLHPQGAPGSPACRRVFRTLRRLLRERRATTYGQLLAP